MPTVHHVVTTAAPNLLPSALLELCYSAFALDRSVTVDVSAGATTSGPRGCQWIAYAVAADRSQELVDALTYEAFDAPVPAALCTLDEHNVAVYTTLEDAAAAIDDASLSTFLR